MIKIYISQETICQENLLIELCASVFKTVHCSDIISFSTRCRLLTQMS
uniref:Uncharacterized protein n=1 Tax=Arundo donax TaxID=35708 RepID=A0A0A9GJH2_ARUDO